MNERTRPIAIWGVGGHSTVVAELLRISGMCVSCFVESPTETDAVCRPTKHDVISALDPHDALAALRKKGVTRVALGFGQCKGRLDIGGMICKADLELVTLIHPSAVIAENSQLGRGVFVGAGCVIDPGVTIGDYSIINHHAVICHKCEIGRACHICPGVVLAGGCVVEDRTWLGVGSTCRDRVRIGAQVFVGCGSNVVKDIPPGWLAMGNPAKCVRRSPDVF
jgi:UDP-N-acetylbacillosamine N-acetyltransferase